MTDEPNTPTSPGDDERDHDDEQIPPFEGLLNPQDEPGFSPASDADAPAP